MKRISREEGQAFLSVGKRMITMHLKEGKANMATVENIQRGPTEARRKMQSGADCRDLGVPR